MRFSTMRMLSGVMGVFLALLLAGCSGPSNTEAELSGLAEEQQPAALQAAGSRAPIYEVDGKGMARVEAALAEAKQNSKHVLLKIGGNWCGWCYKLNDTFHDEETVRELLDAAYVLVMLDSKADMEAINKWSIKPEGYPYLAVLDATGKKLTEKETGSLEKGGAHDPQKVLAFLSQWKPSPRDNAPV